MMNQGRINSDAAVIHHYDPNSLEKHQFTDENQGHSSGYPSVTLPPPPPYPPSITEAKTAAWSIYRTDGSLVDNGSLSNSSYRPDQHLEPISRDGQDGLNAPSHGVASSTTVGAANGSQDYSNYSSYSSSNDPYGYGSTGYQGYYYGYQQQANQPYSPQVGGHQNSGAPYQPLTSFQNSGSYAGSTSYSSTYYNTGDYQTPGGVSSSGYGNQTTQTNSWNDGNYANYPSHHYPSYTSADSSSAHSASTVASTPNYYEQHYKQWADYYSQTTLAAQAASDVTCAPGTENKSVTSGPTVDIPGVSGAYPVPHAQPPVPPPPGTTSWRTEPSSSGLTTPQVAPVTGNTNDDYWRQAPPAFQNHNISHVAPHLQKPLNSNPVSYEIPPSFQQIATSQGPTLQYPAKHQGPQTSTIQYPAAHHGPQSYPSHLQTNQSVDTRGLSKVQIPTNPRIASHLTLGLPKTERDGLTNSSAKPAYLSVSVPKPSGEVSSHGAADSMLKPGAFPPSLRAYVERALARCKDDSQKAASQNIMKEMITNASSDGTLFTRNWDMEPLFSLPIVDTINKGLQSSSPISSFSSSVVSSLSKYKRSPSRRTKSRWEPIPEEKLVENVAYVNPVSVKDASWDQVKEKDKTVSSSKCETKVNGWSNSKFLQSRQQAPNKNVQKPGKKPRLGGDGVSAAENGNASSDSDKEQGLTAYYAGAVALANSPEEKKKRENRFKRFDRGHRAEMKHFRPKAAAGNLYTKKANAVALSKNFEDVRSRAVEDIDWDSLTVKGTCQEIEKRYLRLTSAPDPNTVRPEEVLEKALVMVQNSQKNYLYKCDQLKSIRQDLTVQRIHNELTVKVYETHARFALEAGDLPEYNQCASQLQGLYAEGIKGCNMEFSAYNLLCVILHSNNNRDLVAAMARLPKKAKKDEAIKHALAVRSAVTSGNYVLFFRLYKTAPNLSTCLMDLYVEKMRFEAVKCMSRSYRPIVPVAFIAQVLGFANSSPISEGSSDMGLEECKEWLRAHGASLNVDDSGEMQLDTKASSTSLFMPEPEDAVAHGDTSLAVNDFLTRTS